MPAQVTEETEEEEAPRLRKGTQAVPIFNAGVMRELNKALGARATRKSTFEKKDDEGTEQKKEPEKAETLQPKVPLVALKPVALKPVK